MRTRNTGLFGNREAEVDARDAKQAAAKRRTGRLAVEHDHRLWLGLGGVMVVAVVAIVGVIKFDVPPSHSGPAHA